MFTPPPTPQDDKGTSSTKESLDDLFPTEDEEQSQSKTLLGFVIVSVTDFELSLPVEFTVIYHLSK